MAGELEARWNKALARVAEVEGKLAAHDAAKVTPVADPRSRRSVDGAVQTLLRSQELGTHFLVRTCVDRLASACIRPL